MQIKGWVLGAGLCGLFVACSGTTTRAGGSGGNVGASSAGRSNVGGAGAGTSAGGAHDGGSTSLGAASGGTLNSGGSVSIGGSTASIAGNESGGSESGDGEPSNAAGAANDSDAPPCVITTLAQSCGGSVCHASNPSAGVDLVAPGVASRLVNQPAQHPGTQLGASCPVGDKLVDTTNRSASWLLVKLQGTQGNCGDVMPTVGFLTTAQMSCLVNWINTVQPNGT